jgi:hypothetical protein
VKSSGIIHNAPIFLCAFEENHHFIPLGFMLLFPHYSVFGVVNDQTCTAEKKNQTNCKVLAIEGLGIKQHEWYK